MPEEYQNGIPKSWFLTPEGDPKYEGADLEWAMCFDLPDLSRPRVVRRRMSELDPSLAEPMKGPPFKKHQWFKHHVLRQKREPLEGWEELNEFFNQLLIRDQKIRGHVYGDGTTHHEINRIEGERKKEGLKPLAGGKLFEEWEIDALQKCHYQRGPVGEYGHWH
ncbi:MAG: hypothetical protein L6R42_001591 [Xanthoria sp. 1 TBL-2021]|nr:MAG: hypothetical protein L6R42_001591 [Xanthoria sp. 1 TBL-2021]